MNILVICKRRYTNQDLISDQFGRLFHFPRFWASEGDSVTIIATNYGGYGKQSHLLDGVTFYSLGFPSLLIDYYRNLRNLISTTPADVIIASGDSHFGYLGMRIAKHFRIPFVFDLYHHYADFGSNHIPGMKFLYYAALQHSDLVVCDSKPLCEQVRPYALKTLVAPQGTDNRVFRPMDMQSCRTRLGLLSDAIYIGYTGALDSRFDLETLASAVRSCQSLIPKLRLLVVGPNVAGLDLGHLPCDFRPAVPHEEVPHFINSCNLMLMPYNKSRLAQTCNPSKMSEYIACQKPIVAACVSNVADYLPLSSQYLYNPGDAQGLAAAILEQLENPIIEVFPEDLSWVSIAQRYRAALLELTSATPM